MHRHLNELSLMLLVYEIYCIMFVEVRKMCPQDGHILIPETLHRKEPSHQGGDVEVVW